MCISSAAIRPLERLIHDTIEYTRQRQAYGQPLLNNQVIHFRMAELQTELESFKSLIYRAVGKNHSMIVFIIFCDLLMSNTFSEVKLQKEVRGNVTVIFVQIDGGFFFVIGYVPFIGVDMNVVLNSGNL